MDKNQIYKNNFVKQIINNMREIIKRDPLTADDIRRFRQGKSRKKRKMSPYTQYNTDVFYRLTKILETLDDMRAVQIFLKQYPYAKTLRKHKITRTAYAVYHIEVYFLKVASLKDKLALLINDVYNLGLPDKRVNIGLLSEMKQLKNSPAISLLKRFSNDLDKLVSMRHIIAHRGKYDDRELTEISMYEIVEDKIEPAVFYAKLLTKLYVQKTSKIFKENQVVIEEFLNLFFLSVQ
ncbi:MAG: Cthe_2314 family HEPN domain-containing protein, partial [Candidatus Saccharicenans sp.]|nr:Cthe_2314 family HEPN domain-containing protein [Candidatus Saccharicenans sp.]